MRYIGSKARILDFIADTIVSTYGNVEGAVVADLFAGTSSVSEMLKKKRAQLISNDYLIFSYAFQIAKIKLNKEPEAKASYADLLALLNNLDGSEGFFFREYSSEGTAQKRIKRNYFSGDNARKIDAICQKLAEMRTAGFISEDMFFLLSASLVDAITKISNTSGTYGAFLKTDDQRKLKKLELLPFVFFDNGFENHVYCKDILELIDDVEGDILYLDPPYNGRQYPPYYHILETAVLYDDPPIYGTTGRRPYKKQVSPFCQKEKALSALTEVVKRARFKHIYVSYNTEGIVNLEDMEKAFSEFGETQRFYKPYRRYKSNSGGDKKKKIKEVIVYVKKR